MSQIGQRAYDAVISPASVLARKPNHKRFHLRRDPWAAGIGTTAGTVELRRHQAPIPGEKGIRLGDARDILKSFAAEPFGDSARVDRSASVNRSRAGRCALRMRFSAARYSLRSNNS